MTTGALESLTAGTLVPFGGDRFTVVDDALAAAFAPGDALHVDPATGQLLHVPGEVRRVVTEQVDAAVAAFETVRAAPRSRLRTFFTAFADALADDAVWSGIEAANAADVERAHDAGRSTTRLAVTPRMREDMVAGLREWDAILGGGGAGADDAGIAASGDDDGGAPLGGDVQLVRHDGWEVEVVPAPLGVVAFVFEGRPNVFADAAGVLATGNTAVLRIGGDALGTAEAIRDGALRPALAAAGLPEGAVSLLPVRDRSAGWALFSDARLALAVARGSGPAVTQLSGVARSAGVPVSAHGTGGAWLVADATADVERFAGAVRHSLDRKVCNTLNVAAVVAERAAELVPVLLAAADEAAAARSGTARVHVVAGSERWLPAGELDRRIEVHRADGVHTEPRASLLPEAELGTEWEWEDTPELTLVVVDDVADAVALFNRHSPHFVASLISSDAAAHADFRDAVDAPFVGDGFTRWVDGQYALAQPELGLSNWEHGRLLARAGILTGADLTTRRVFAHHDSAHQHR
ncbi:Glutamate-5-semialdehyde dehydrogenase [Beutenbergia cavernae DSM 12333]|uniref:Glutamate-5-semialdehyde dehydrogenase n=1 Tax=Beutenbergia cavernae (strain ATCC BAA-8 / DSM 12333 / CCUG 43141 / JCM 11478 / NBRC 16432 / NCIMB 13614 / HKI 0122) TaxID=471853 RepID=C5C3R3_BEUC1|nr:aldehyde dehydrogenase family protein [Beutenbergia cavernae]ACQ81972.1 Glutamate-5-semialdehyde dehydrogenase [Beutenbergia cavernae DSM 12333]